jgi:hypothetical protein
MKQEYKDRAGAIALKLRAIRDEANALEEEMLKDKEYEDDSGFINLSDGCVFIDDAYGCFIEFEPQEQSA